MQKTDPKNLLIVIMLVVVLSGGLLLQRGRAQAPVLQNQQDTTLRYISVIGTGQAGGVPDHARVSLGVENEADTAGQALNQNNQQMQALLTALRQEGIPAQDIQTQSIQLRPRYADTQTSPGGTPPISGYIATNIVEVRVRNLQNLGDILDSAVNAGANVIHNISFEISDQTELVNQAREAAMQDARQKAEQLAALVNAQLAEVISITESDRTPFPLGRADLPVAEAAVPVEPGTQFVQLDVQVSWRLVGGLGIPGTGNGTPTLVGTPVGTPAGTPAGTATRTPVRTATGTPVGTPVGTPESTPVGTPVGTPEETPAGTPAGTPEATPDGTPDGTPAETPVGTPAGTPAGTPEGTPEGTPGSP